MLKRKVKATVAVGLLALACAAGSMIAYLTDTDSKTNTFTLGVVDGELTEPSFSTVTGMVANGIYPKDPIITNNGTNDAIVFIEYTIPAEEVIVADDDGTPLESALTEMFVVLATDGNAGVNEGWIQVGDKATISDAEENVVGYKYVYGYKDVLTTGDATDPIFNNVQFANIVEPTTKTTFEIEVKADIIQANGILESDDIEELDATALASTYEKFTGQESG